MPCQLFLFINYLFMKKYIIYPFSKVFILFYLCSCSTFAQDFSAFSAVNTGSSFTPIVTVSSLSSSEIPSGTIVPGVIDVSEISDPYYKYTLYLNYSVPIYVYFDWYYVHQNALNLVMNGAEYDDYNLQNKLLSLAYNGFTCYSNYHGYQQKLEFRAGTGNRIQISGTSQPLLPNFNPILSTKTFAAP